MILNLTALTEDDLNSLGERIERISLTSPSWLTILIVDCLEDPEDIKMYYHDEDADFVYYSVILTNIDKLKNLKLTYKDNRINQFLLSEIRNEKTRRFNLFLEEKLKYKSDLLDKVKKI